MGNLMGERQSRGKGVISWKKSSLMHCKSHVVDFPGCHSKCCLEQLNFSTLRPMPPTPFCEIGRVCDIGRGGPWETSGGPLGWWKMLPGVLKNKFFGSEFRPLVPPIGRGRLYCVGQTHSQPQKPPWNRFQPYFSFFYNEVQGFSSFHKIFRISQG